MTSTHITHVGGIMIVDSRKAGGDHPFPTPNEYDSSWAYYNVAEEWEDWLVVAIDPGATIYGDEADMAADKTNWAIIMSVFGEEDEPSTVNRWSDYDNSEMMRALTDGGAVIVSDKLLVAPDRTEWLEELAELAGRLEECFLLDEDAYYQLESEAWGEYMMDGLRFDTLRALSGWPHDEETGIDDETEEALDEAWSDIAHAACQYLQSENGFTGEHSPDFSECVADAIVDALIATMRGGEYSRWEASLSASQ